MSIRLPDHILAASPHDGSDTPDRVVPPPRSGDDPLAERPARSATAPGDASTRPTRVTPASPGASLEAARARGIAAVGQAVTDALDESPRLVKATFPDGSQVLVTEWPSGEIEVARRDDVLATWGPPVEGVVER